MVNFPSLHCSDRKGGRGGKNNNQENESSDEDDKGKKEKEWHDNETLFWGGQRETPISLSLSLLQSSYSSKTCFDCFDRFGNS